MGISAVGIDGGDRRARRDHPRLAYTSQNKLLHPIFRETPPLRDRLMHMAKCLDQRCAATPRRQTGAIRVDGPSSALQTSESNPLNSPPRHRNF